MVNVKSGGFRERRLQDMLGTRQLSFKISGWCAFAGARGVVEPAPFLKDYFVIKVKVPFLIGRRTSYYVPTSSYMIT